MTRLFWRLRLAANRLVLRLHLGPVIEFCKTCGARVDQVWWAEDYLWLTVVRTPSGVRCVRCFDREASAAGYALRWEPHVEAVKTTSGWGTLPTARCRMPEVHDA